MAQVSVWALKNYGGAKFGHCSSQAGHDSIKKHNIGMLIPVTPTGMGMENLRFGECPEVITMLFDMSPKRLNGQRWWDQINSLAFQIAQVLSKGQTVVVYPAQPEQAKHTHFICAALAKRVDGCEPEEALKQMAWTASGKLAYELAICPEKSAEDWSNNRISWNIYIYIYIYIYIICKTE